jgi:hypothetical protein
MIATVLLDYPKAPRRFRIWKAGANTGDFGVVSFTPAAARAVMSAYERRGHAVAIDIEHATNPRANPAYDPSRPPEMAGYLALRLIETADGPELWADPVRWSDTGRQQIESGQRCYFSPDWDFDRRTGEPIALNKVSLVAEPGTYGINLLASRAAAEGTAMDLELLMALINGAKKLAETAQDPALKAMGADLAAQLEAAAQALGLNVGGEPKPPDAAAGAGATEEEEKQAAAKAAAAKASPAKPLTMEQLTAAVQLATREEAEKGRLLASAKGRPGVTDAMVAFLGARSLAEVREFIATLSPVPSDDKKVPARAVAGGSGGGLPADLAETIRVRLNVDKKVLDGVRERALAGKPVGVLSVERIREIRRNVGAAPKR